MRNYDVAELAQTLFEEIGDAAFIADPETMQLVDVNPMAQRMTGLRRTELLRVPLDQLFRSDNDEGLGHLRRALHTTQTFHSQEGYSLRHGTGGTWTPVNLTLTRLHTEQGQLGLVLARDITERVEAAERLRLANTALERHVQDRTAELARVNQALREEVAEHERAAAALRESEGRFRGAFEHTGVAMVLTDTDNRFVRVNAAFARLFGYSEEEMVGMTMAAVTHPNDLAESYSRREGLLAGAGAFFQIEKRYTHHDGHTFWGLTNVCLVRDTAGRPLLYVGQVQDITEQRRAVEALTVFRALIDRVQDSIEVIDPDTGRVLDVNETACISHGYTRAEYLSLTIPDIDPTMSGPGVWGQTVDTLRRVGSAISEGQHRRKDGSHFPVEVHASYIRNGREYIVAVVRDITERKLAEESLRQAQQRLAHVIASSPAVLFTLNIVGNQIRGIGWISDNLREVLGHSPADACGEGWWLDNVHPEDQTALVAQIQDHLFGHGYATHEYRFGHGDGRYRWTRGEWRLMRDARGRPVEVVGSWSDITERRQLEDQFRQSQKMEAVGRLAGGVAHDFNNLLTIINGYGSLMMETLPAGDPNRELAREVIAAGERAAGLTRQLLAFSRKAVIEPRVLDLKVLVSDVDRMLRRIVGEDIQLVVAADPDVGAVKADPGQIEQVIVNLVVNARDAMPRGGRITIELRNVELDETYTRAHPNARPGPHVLLAVTDTGYGMDQATVARVFEPFFTTKGEHGTGLGLATVHGIVTQGGGHVGVYSEVGHGSTFKVYLPRVAHQPSAPLSRIGPAVMPRGNEMVLLVEDEDGVRALTRHILRGCGYIVLEAHEGSEAIRLCEGHAGVIDLLVSDVVLPRMGGREVAERVSAFYPRIKVLFLSGYTDDAVVRHGILEAQVAFLQKPFTPASLAQKVREVLDT